MKPKFMRSKRSFQSLRNKEFMDKMFRGTNPVCFHCKQQVFRPHSGCAVPLYNHATIDHIYSKRDLRRCLVSEKRNIVISCYECNQNRNKEEESKFREYYQNIERINIIELLTTNN